MEFDPTLSTERRLAVWARRLWLSLPPTGPTASDLRVLDQGGVFGLRTVDLGLRFIPDSATIRGLTVLPFAMRPEEAKSVLGDVLLAHEELEELTSHNVPWIPHRCIRLFASGSIPLDGHVHSHLAQLSWSRPTAPSLTGLRAPALRDLGIGYNGKAFSSLDGVQTSTRLDRLSIGPLTNFRDASALCHVETAVIEIESCRKVDWGSLAGARVGHLILRNVGPLPSLGFVRELIGLHSVTLDGSTDVVDGDLSCLDQLDAWFPSRKHYNRGSPSRS